MKDEHSIAEKVAIALGFWFVVVPLGIVVAMTMVWWLMKVITSTFSFLASL
jgi:hypothetical protein